VYSALRFGRGGAPIWLTALQLAEAWGMHPDDVLQRPGGLKWAARWACYRDMLHKAQENAK
jgi:hypothetical protein